MSFKALLKSILIFFHLDITKNIEYDRLTKLILKKTLNKDSNCIDIGCHKGEILDLMMKASPAGKHFGFEPLPHLFTFLINKFTGKAGIYPYALSDVNGTTVFHHVRNAPAYSGMKMRRYDIPDPEIEEISVEVKKLDDLLPEESKIDLVKIDVEGAEFHVIKGAENLLKKNKPYIIFECGLGASDYYETNPSEMYNYITYDIGLKISLLKSFIRKKEPLTLNEFREHYSKASEYYFIAYN